MKKPLKWKLVKHSTGYVIYEDVESQFPGGNNRKILEADSNTQDTILPSQETAEYIVRAVNAFPKLLAALQAAFLGLGDDMQNWFDEFEQDDINDVQKQEIYEDD